MPGDTNTPRKLETASASGPRPKTRAPERRSKTGSKSYHHETKVWDRLPSKTIPLPRRLDWKAILDLEGKWILVVHWILRRIELGLSLSASSLARELHIKTRVACRILKPKDQQARQIQGWVEWARSQLQTGRGVVGAELPHSQPLENIRQSLREALGSVSNDLQDTDFRGEPREQ